MKLPDTPNIRSWQATQKPLELKTILISTALISLALSFYQVLNDQVINSDGILYVQLASLIQADQWHKATQLYNWLFYPYLISEVASLTNLSFEVSAYLLNAVFTSITCCIFILVVKELSTKSSSRLLLLAALIILTFPSINEYRQIIIRDHGYWAFYMLSSYFFIKSFKQQKTTDFTLLILSCGISSLFRVEGVVFLAILPFTLCIRAYKSKAANKNTITAIYISLIILSGCILLFGISEYGKLVQIKTLVLNLFSNDSNQEVTAVSHAKQFLNSLSPPKNYTEGFAPAVLILTFLLILTTEIISSAGLFHALFIASALFKISGSHRTCITKEWWILATINILILSVFLLDKFFLAGRYPLALSLTAITLIPPLVNRLFSNQYAQNKNLKIALILLFSLITVDPFISFGSNKEYLKEAGKWILSSRESKEYSLFTNSPLIQYYSGKIGTNRRQKLDFEKTVRKLHRININKFNIFAIKVSRNNKGAENELNSLFGNEPTNTFKNKRGDRILIYTL